MAYTIGVATTCLIVLLFVFTYFGENFFGLQRIQSFAPDAPTLLLDTRTDDGAYIKTLSQRPYNSDKCLKRVRGQTVQGFCWSN